MNNLRLDTSLPHRGRNLKPSLIVLHATAGATARSSIDRLRKVGSSYHFILARDGKDSSSSERADGSEPVIFHCAPEKAHAFHTSTTIPAPSGEGSVNKTSIGISLANVQNRKRHEDYPRGQLSALDQLIVYLKDRHPLRWVTTHAICQPWNRVDPLLIDAAQIAKRHGLQLWKPTDAEVRAHTPKRTKLR
jgi:N-acetyl-anhydromuramyl-L-alanine amidase AmpD